MASARVPTADGEFLLSLYRNDVDGLDQLVFTHGDVAHKEGVLTRVHSECLTGDLLGSLRCDCGPQLQAALAMIGRAEAGALVYLRQEGRGIGLLDKLRAYNLQDAGFDTVDANLELGHQADSRDYATAALILRDLEVGSVDLITNNPKKIEGLQQEGITVRKRVPLLVPYSAESAVYMLTKAQRMNHILALDALAPDPTSRRSGD